MKQNIFVVLTTNHKDNITGPLLRSGRADLVIDIDNFDAKSIKETFLTSARRMKNRGVKVIGYDTVESLQKAIEGLDLDQLAELATLKGFTVRDIEMLILEMAAHDYYQKKGQEGLKWNNDNFILVLEKSQGSIRDDSTGELKLGDRYALEELRNPQLKEVSPQEEFPFAENTTNIYDAEKFKEMKGFKE
jgi:SpoVK/Ycf46/Vps4 family AAA+-type ATPase